MFCQKCGNSVPDGANFCNFCGTQLQAPAPKENAASLRAEPVRPEPGVPMYTSYIPPQESDSTEHASQPEADIPENFSRPETTPPHREGKTPRKKRKKQKSAKSNVPAPKNKKLAAIIAVSGGCGVALLVVLVLLVLSLVNPVSRAVQLAQQGETGEAAQMYTDRIGTKESYRNDLADTAQKAIDDAKEQFARGNLTLEQAQEQIKVFSCFPDAGVQAMVTEGLDYLSNAANSETAYQEGLEYLNQQDYKNAIASLRRVVPTDGNYQDAENLLDNAIAAYRQQVIDRADQAAAEGDYVKAIAELAEGLLVIPADQTLEEKKESYQQQSNERMKTETIQQAEAAVADGKWEEAVRLLQSAKEVLPSDADITRMLNETSEQYETAVLSSAEQLIADNRGEEAVAALNQALSLLPDSQALKTKLASIASIHPISLKQEVLLNSDEWDWDSGEPKDTFGTDYSTAKNYVRLFNSNAWSGDPVDSGEFRIYQKYSRLTFTAAPLEGMAENGSCYFQVFADEEVVYTSPTIEQKTDPFTVDLDIAGCDYLKIVAYIGGGSVILSDLLLYP